MTNEACEFEEDTALAGRNNALVSGYDSSRLAFEDWASDHGTNKRAIERDGDGYKLMQTHQAWEAWKACATSFGVKWHRYPDQKPGAIGSYCVSKSVDGILEIEWGYFSENGKCFSPTGFLIVGIVTHFSKPPRLPSR